ncbi:hypothetical protein ACFQY8_02275 [Alloscardovia venturai]|uniref:Uncharacterized protein n=1 Tax=Alloscardovia venturai TaxID=1769421 RepID=A0ABW2Y6C4_9BIFI
MKRMVKRIPAVIIAFMALWALSIGFMPNEAQALGGNCTAWLVNGVGYTHGRGNCKALNKDTKAQVTLDISGRPDFHSVWFTRLKYNYDTPQWSAAMNYGWVRGSRIDYGYR